MSGLIVVGCGLLGGFVGAAAGLIAAASWADLEPPVGGLEYVVAGAVAGAAVGAWVGTELVA